MLTKGARGVFIVSIAQKKFLIAGRQRQVGLQQGTTVMKELEGVLYPFPRIASEVGLDVV